MRNLPRWAASSVAVLLCATQVAAAAPPPRRTAVPNGTRVAGDTQQMNINRISMPITNSGSFSWDHNSGLAGLEYPKGSGKRAVFASGLWLAARVAGQPRTTTTGYFDEFSPGAVIAGAPDDPARPEYKVYRLDRHYATTAQRDAALAEYLSGAVPHGAQGVGVLGDGSLDIAGDEMCWSVYNDLDPTQHLSQPGGTAPLGVEVQQTTFAFDVAGALANTVYARYRIINRGSQVLDEVYVGLWADPDIGDDTDDLAGSDVARGFGYCYNATNNDLVYGLIPPAVGFDIVQGVLDPVTRQPRTLTACEDFLAGVEPASGGQSFNALCGLNLAGGSIVNPTTSLVTHYQHSGDPVASTGWLDTTPGEKRLLVASGPTTLQPGEQQDIVVAIVAAQGANRLGGITQLRSYDTQAQLEFDSGTLIRLGVGERPLLGFALERPCPNPTRGALTVAFSLPTDAPAQIELLDVAGRSIARQDVGALGSGRHVVRLAPDTARLPVGLYLVRLTHSGHALIAKAVVTR